MSACCMMPCTTVSPGLPNRELMLDRLAVAALRAKTEALCARASSSSTSTSSRASTSSFGLVVGDSLLLTVARRLQRHLGPHDTLARVGGDQFAILLSPSSQPAELAALAERVRRSLRAPIKIAGQEIVLTGSIGIAVYDGETTSHRRPLKEAEIAMYRAKRGGADRIEIFRPEMRADRDDRVALESDLRKALAKNQIKVLYQPIIYLPTEELAGFEALVRWEHPKRGMINPVDFVPIAERVRPHRASSARTCCCAPRTRPPLAAGAAARGATRCSSRSTSPAGRSSART